MVPRRSTGSMQGPGENGKTAAEGNRELLKSPLFPLYRTISVSTKPVLPVEAPPLRLETDGCEQSESREPIFWPCDPHTLHLAFLFFSNGGNDYPVHTKSLQSCPTLCNPWPVACQTRLSVGFSRQGYRSGLPHPLQRTFLTQGLNPHLICFWQADSSLLAPQGKPTPGRVLY